MLYGVTLVLALDALAVSLFKNLILALVLLGLVAVLFAAYLILARGARRGRLVEDTPLVDAEHHDELAPVGAERP